MKKIKITELAAELDMDVDKLIKLKMEKLGPQHFKGYGKNTWLTHEGANLLRIANIAPLAVPNKLWGTVLNTCRNPAWLSVKIDGIEGRQPVRIPRRKVGLLIGKRILIDAITDANGGTTYQHEDCRR